MESTSLHIVCRKFLQMLATICVLVAGCTNSAMAEEMPQGMRGWWYYIGMFQDGGYAADPLTACKLTAKNNMSRDLVDMKPHGDSGTVMACIYLHAMDAANDVLGPNDWGLTFLACHPGYTSMAPGVCVKRDEPPMPLNCTPGKPGFTLGNPVTVSTGAKLQSEIDFTGTPAGALQITRTYRPFSQFISGQSAGTNWSFSFDRALTIQRWSTDGRPRNLVGIAGDASKLSFYWNATKGIYESTLDRGATLVPLSENYDEWLMVKDGRADRFGYDGFGRLVATTQLVAAGTNPQQFRLSYTYGSEGANTGHVRSITYPSGNRVDITYGSDGRPTSLSLDAPDAAAPVTLIKGITYRPFGGVAGWAWGNSTSSKPNIYARKFDLDGRIVGFPLGHPGKNGVARTISYDAADRITHARHAGTATGSALDQRYFYDDLDRLTGFDSANVSHGFSYDKNGNRSAARFGGTTYKYTTSSASNRLNSTTGPAPAKVNTYDAAGNITTDGTIQYTYGPGGRLQSALAGGIKTSYHYNGFGQRVAKSVQGRLIAHYVYDDQGHLLGEYDGTGQPIQETIYLGDLPIAIATPAQGSKPPGIHYIYTDHLQTPRVITRASDNTIVWRWDQADPFGLYQPRENPSGIAAFTYNPRFPGQLYDKETNNHYNYFRDYDPQTGRYVQSDPIGLLGGINTYQYVRGNPISSKDQLGLAPDLNLTNPNDKLHQRMEERINVPGWYVVAGHGNPWFMEGPNYKRLFVHQLAAIIKADPRYKGQPILLASCNTSLPGGIDPRNGKAIPSLAQALANHMNNTVMGSQDVSLFPPNSVKWGAGNKLIPPGPTPPWVTVRPSNK